MVNKNSSEVALVIIIVIIEYLSQGPFSPPSHGPVCRKVWVVVDRSKFRQVTGEIDVFVNQLITAMNRSLFPGGFPNGVDRTG